jgi:Leucine-rich repeat (LRR) protein
MRRSRASATAASWLLLLLLVPLLPQLLLALPAVAEPACAFNLSCVCCDCSTAGRVLCAGRGVTTAALEATNFSDSMFCPDDALNHMFLDLSRNFITVLSPGVFGPLHMCVTNQDLFVTFNLSFNAISVADNAFPLYTAGIDLSNNRMTSLPNLDSGFVNPYYKPAFLNLSSQANFTALTGAIRGPYNVVLDVSNNSLSRFNYSMPLFSLILDKNTINGPIDASIMSTFRRASYPPPGSRVISLTNCGVTSIANGTFFFPFPEVSVDISSNAVAVVSAGAFPTRLASLNLSHNTLSALPIGVFNQVDSVDLSHNKITELTSSARYIDYSYNEISSIADGALAGAYSVLLSHNRITSLPTWDAPYCDDYGLTSPVLDVSSQLVPLTCLTVDVGGGLCARSLIVSNNSISADCIDVSGNLGSLDLSHNPLGRLDPAMRLGGTGNAILLSHCGISSIAPGTFANVQYNGIDLSSNLLTGLSNISFANFSGLYNLNLSNNSLEVLAPGTFVGLASLENVDLSGNKLRDYAGSTTIDGIECEILLECKTTNTFSLIWEPQFPGPLEPSSAFAATATTALDGAVATEIPALRALRARAAAMMTQLAASHQAARALAPPPCGALLDCTCCACSTSGFPMIDCSGRSVTSAALAATNLSSLLPAGTPVTVVDLSRNSIVELPDGAFASVADSLLFLNLSSNGAEGALRGDGAAFKGLALLEVLDLSANSISEVAAAAQAFFRALWWLRLPQNRLTALPQLGMPVSSVEILALDLSFNAITALPSAACTVMGATPAKICLELRSNALAAIDVNAFGQGQCSALACLDLQYNELTTLANGTFAGLPFLMYVGLGGNALPSYDGETGSKAVEAAIIAEADGGLATFLDWNPQRGFPCRP